MKETIDTIYKNPKVFFNLIFIIVSFCCLQIALGYFLIQQSSINQLKKTLSKITERIQSDLVYEDDKWNTEKYLADPSTPHPNGSSGFLSPLYIITNEGFVIERNLPIKGYLDSSDYKHLKTFTKPQFVNGATNERWRVLSKELINNDESHGIIMVSIYNPDILNLEGVDKKLIDNLNLITNKIIYKNHSIDITSIDIRNVHYEVAFEIVNKFNKVLLNNGRTPSFIDPSYVYTELKDKEKLIKDEASEEQFFLHTQNIMDHENKSRGIIVAAKSMGDIQQALDNYLFMASIFNIIFIIPLSLIAVTFLKPLKRLFIKQINFDQNVRIPKKISFNKKTGEVIIDEEKINIPFDSNQFYLCEAIFSAPKKRWENDELLKKLGEELSYKNSRIVYDAALAINKKLLLKLVDYKNKTYRLNPQFLPSIF